MNPRIKELAAQATRQYSPTYYTQEWSQGGAELMVQEGMAFCDETRSAYLKHRKASDDFTDKNIYAEGEAASDTIKYKMKQHFGVE